MKKTERAYNREEQRLARLAEEVKLRRVNTRNHPDTPPPTTAAEQEQLRRAQDKRDRRRTHRRGAVTVIEGER